MCRAPRLGEWPGGVSPPGSHRTVRDSLPSYGSRHPVDGNQPSSTSACPNGSSLAVGRQASPGGPSPSLQPHYRAFTTTTRRSAPVPRTGTQPLAVPAAWGSPVRDRPPAQNSTTGQSPCRGDRFPRSMQEPRPRSRHLHAGHHLANQQAPARLIPGLQSIPGFDVNLFLRHVISGSLALAFVIHTCRAQRRDFSRDAHHHGSLPQQLAVVCGLRLHSGRGGPPGPTGPSSSISCTAPHSESGSSTSSLLQRSWHTSGRRPRAWAQGSETTVTVIVLVAWAVTSGLSGWFSG